LIIDSGSGHEISVKKAVVKGLWDRVKNATYGSGQLAVGEAEFLEIIKHSGYDVNVVKNWVNETNVNDRSTTKDEKKWMVLPHVGRLNKDLRGVFSEKWKVTYQYRNKMGKWLKSKSEKDFVKKKGIVYELSCNECSGVYIGESKRKVSCRIREHKKDCVTGNKHNALAEHVQKTNHTIDWDHVKIIANETNWIKRRVREALCIQENQKNVFNGNCGVALAINW
jgi:hypothetical protein